MYTIVYMWHVEKCIAAANFNNRILAFDLTSAIPFILATNRLQNQTKRLMEKLKKTIEQSGVRKGSPMFYISYI